MGIFDYFLSDDKRIAKLQRTLTDRDVQPEDRDAAARWLADNGTPRALVALLTRFDMNLENGLKDKAEKDFAQGLITGHGEAAWRPLDHHLPRCKQIAIPIRLYVEMRGLEAAILKAVEVLESERDKDDFKPQKKTDLLKWLTDHKHPSILAAAAPSLVDFDEGVRYAASEAIIAQHDDAGRSHLQVILTNPEEDSIRLKVRVATIFVQRGWTVDDPTTVAAAMPPGFTLRENRLVAA